MVSPRAGKYTRSGLDTRTSNPSTSRTTGSPNSPLRDAMPATVCRQAATRGSVLARGRLTAIDLRRPVDPGGRNEGELSKVEQSFDNARQTFNIEVQRSDDEVGPRTQEETMSSTRTRIAASIIAAAGIAALAAAPAIGCRRPLPGRGHRHPQGGRSLHWPFATTASPWQPPSRSVLLRGTGSPRVSPSTPSSRSTPSSLTTAPVTTASSSTRGAADPPQPYCGGAHPAPAVSVAARGGRDLGGGPGRSPVSGRPTRRQAAGRVGPAT